MKKENLINKLAILSAELIAVFMLFSFSYEDLQIRTVWGLNFLDVAFEGRIEEFYIYTAKNLHNLPLQYMSGNFIKIIPWSIWNIPIWICTYFLKMDICEYPIMYVWSELYLVFILYCSYRVFVKIAEFLEISKEDIYLGTLLFVFSPFVYIGVFYSGQSDVLELLFFLLSVYAVFKDRKKTFWLWAIIGCWMKPFYLLSYVAIILLYNKDIIKIVEKVIGLFSLSGFFKIALYYFPMYKFSSKAGPINDMLKYMLHGAEGINNIQISLLVLVLVFIYFTVYATDIRKNVASRQVIYYSALPLLAYFCFIDFEHYRMILLIPVLILTIIVNHEYMKINIIFLTILNITGVLCITGSSTYFLNMRYIKGTLLERVLVKIKHLNYDSGIRSNALELIPHFELIVSVAAVAFVMTAFLFCVINYPTKKKKFIQDCGSYSKVLVWCNVYLIVPVLFWAFVRL